MWYCRNTHKYFNRMHHQIRVVQLLRQEENVCYLIRHITIMVIQEIKMWVKWNVKTFPPRWLFLTYIDIETVYKDDALVFLYFFIKSFLFARNIHVIFACSCHHFREENECKKDHLSTLCLDIILLALPCCTWFEVVTKKRMFTNLDCVTDFSLDIYKFTSTSKEVFRISERKHCYRAVEKLKFWLLHRLL